MVKNRQSGQEKVINFLSSGKTLTEQTALSRFGVANLRSTISHVRNKVSYPIRPVKTRNGTGYRLVTT